MVNGGLMINNQSMMVNGGSWWFMNVHDSSWWFGNKPWLIASTRSHATPSTNNWNNTKIFKPSWKDYFTKHESTMFWRWSRDVRLQTWCLLLSLCFFAKNSSKLESPATHFTPSEQKKAESSFRFLANGQHVSNFGSWNWTKSSKQDHRKSGPLPSSYCLGLWRSPVRVQRRPSRPVIKKMERTIWPKKWNKNGGYTPQRVILIRRKMLISQIFGYHIFRQIHEWSHERQMRTQIRTHFTCCGRKNCKATTLQHKKHSANFHYLQVA